MANNESDFFQQRVQDRSRGARRAAQSTTSQQIDKAAKHLLIVCTGNVCRSPMAAGLIRDRLRWAGLSDQVHVSSAGVFALEGAPASADGVDVLAERGVDISDHRARQLDDQMLDQADLVLVMEERHRQAIFARAPQHLHKVMLFSELAGEHADIADPYRQGRPAYERTLETLDIILDAGWRQLMTRLLGDKVRG
jgi:protein-tyrosine-phosphatase